MTHLVHAIGHLKINTTVTEAAVREATEILGLHVTHSDEKQVWLSSNGRAAELVLLRANENSTHTIGLEALTRDAVREAASRVEAAGCRILSSEPSLDCMAAGVTFATPDGLRFEIHTPVRDVIYNRRHATTGVGASRMDHINIISPDPVATRAQLEVIGGLRLSERMVNESLSWMYGGNRQHHILGLVKGKVGLHHYSFEFLEFNQYLRLGDTLDRFDKQMLWGPGRHRPGDNTYAYYTDPSGAMVECSGSMALIADDAAFTPNVITNLARPGNVRDMNVWGTPAPLEWREFHFPFASID
ncbi:glyoxalase/bleomycin resistance protein/dioxygenase superfamily protein [Bradyrhizobium macuxiense]|uniref:Glyoxalase/bleomycin resistance protein/dioxygenase superfamily protein n=1 Tax=Bradyrhizobium macuxiense TaxID=1755647 RepID=A0A560KXA6_9BRAD|nr:VOC family protein [Bradyrhizobium macuxiense]TWB87787.1 glyoxalase/bleomycin resistance protein/dioxygenase superfamily protein [Bradyrhizobium macuxiense]